MTGLAAIAAAVSPAGPSDLGVHAVKTLIVVVVLIAGLRLLGKREMSQLNVYDLALLMTISNAVQNAMTGGRGNLTIGLVTSSTVVATAWALTRVIARRPALESRIVGSPTILVHDGVVLKDRMRRERIDDDELRETLRGHGLDDPGQAALVVLEVDGTLSVVPRDRGRGRAGPRPE